MRFRGVAASRADSRPKTLLLNTFRDLRKQTLLNNCQPPDFSGFSRGLRAGESAEALDREGGTSTSLKSDALRRSKAFFRTAQSHSAGATSCARTLPSLFPATGFPVLRPRLIRVQMASLNASSERNSLWKAKRPSPPESSF